MLVLSRDCDSVIRIGEDIKVKVLSIRKQRVKLGVDAPSDVRVWREEIAPHPIPRETSAKRGSNGCPPAKQFAVLLVEDDPDHALLITRVLADCQMTEVTRMATGMAAIEALEDDAVAGQPTLRPQLVLLDLHLPDIHGLEVLRQIRCMDHFRTLPVVILSCDRRDHLGADCLEAGANAFVGKSSGYREFRESVARIATFWRRDCCLPTAEAALPA